MAGAAVAPALGVIEAHFSHDSSLLVQMIISMPAIFIVLTNLLFPRLCRHFSSKTLVMAGLLLYTVGGCAAGACSRIGVLLATRALVGIGVGIIMPLSTGLLAFYFSRDKQEKLMGYSSAMNQMGGVVATLISGLLAAVSWRASFLVYLMGLISIVLCLFFLPKDRIAPDPTPSGAGSVRATDFLPYLACMFFLMISFFIYPSNFAIETSAAGIIPQKWISVIMASMDFVAFFGGLLFVRVKQTLGDRTRLFAPALFLAGYLLLSLSGGWAGTLAGSFCIGFANGAGIPFLISAVSKKAGKAAAATVLPLISAALYLAQFLTPMIVAAIRTLPGSGQVSHLPYAAAAVSSGLLLILSAVFLKEAPAKRLQEADDPT